MDGCRCEKFSIEDVGICGVRPMKSINWKNALHIVTGITGIVFVIKLVANNMVVSFSLVWNSISLSVTIITVLAFLFSQILWKFKCFQKWLVLIPNLNGVWKGEIHTDFINPFTYEEIKKIDAELTIKQSLFHISCRMKTNNMTSHSVSANFLLDDDNQKCQLLYTYLSTPKQTVQYISRIHFGTVLYDMNDHYEVNKLEGNYWTGRETVGFITLFKIRDNS